MLAHAHVWSLRSKETGFDGLVGADDGSTMGALRLSVHVITVICGSPPELIVSVVEIATTSRSATATVARALVIFNDRASTEVIVGSSKTTSLRSC